MESKNLNEKDLSELTIRFLSEVNRIGISFYDIAKKTGAKESMFTKIKKGIQEPSKKFLNTFFECYPEVNKVWLLTGESTNDTDMLFSSIDNDDRENMINITTSRFLEVINELQITAYTLEKENGVKNAQAKVSHYKKGVTKSISLDIIVGLCEAYPQVNANYILTGNGPMFKEEQATQNINEHSQVTQIDNTKQIRHMLDVINEQQKTIENLTEYIKKIQSKPKNSIENKKDGMTA